MGKHKFTDEIAQGKRQFFTKKIIACIERATVLRAKNNTNARIRSTAGEGVPSYSQTDVWLLP